MTEHAGKLLSEIVGVARHYQRSIRIDADYGRDDALDGYVCHRTASALVQSMAKQIGESNQRAFTWTGPYGGGKSSLAVALASAVGPDKKLRAKARSLLRIDEHPLFDKAFPVRRGWLIVPVVGKRASVDQGDSQGVAQGARTASRRPQISRSVADLGLVLGGPRGKPRRHAADHRRNGQVPGSLRSRTTATTSTSSKISRRRPERTGGLVVVGILHQSFGQYAARLGVDTRDDWAKIQGRYSDILVGRGKRRGRRTHRPGDRGQGPPSVGVRFGLCRRGGDPLAPSAVGADLRRSAGRLLAAASSDGRPSRSRVEAAVRPERAQHLRLSFLGRAARLPLLSWRPRAVRESALVSPGPLLGLSPGQLGTRDPRLARRAPLGAGRRSRRAGGGQD